jgi:hypothetical protein
MQEHSTAHTRLIPPVVTSPFYRRYRGPVGGFVTSLCGPALAGQRGGGGKAAALKLDTRILKGNPFLIYRPAHVPYSDRAAYSGRPINYPVYENAHNFRAKIQEFSGGGFEVVITAINLQRHADMASMHLKRGPRTERKGDSEAVQKAARKAKRTVRLKCKEMGADHLVTFTTRETISRDALRGVWARFTDNVSYHLKRKFSYVCVCEPHPSNPDHLHLHVAIRGRLSAREMVIFRRCWYIALGGKGNERGPAAPGGFNIKHIKVRGGAHRRMDKIASYISKYITKDVTGEFNKKRYWASKIDLVAARAYWLKARTIDDALLEFCKDFDYVHSGDKNDLFQARSLDLIWMRFCPDDGAVPSVVPF